jgi:hypothetical protein
VPDPELASIANPLTSMSGHRHRSARAGRLSLRRIVLAG